MRSGRPPPLPQRASTAIHRDSELHTPSQLHERFLMASQSLRCRMSTLLRPHHRRTASEGLRDCRRAILPQCALQRRPRRNDGPCDESTHCACRKSSLPISASFATRTAEFTSSYSSPPSLEPHKDTLDLEQKIGKTHDAHSALWDGTCSR